MMITMESDDDDQYGKSDIQNDRINLKSRLLPCVHKCV